MKKSLLLTIIAMMFVLSAQAKYYIVGDYPLGEGWRPNAGVEMTQIKDGTYVYYCDSFYGDARFVFADSLTENYDQWTDFGESMRIGPTGNVQTIGTGSWVTTQKANADETSYYKFNGKGEKYIINFDPENGQFRIDIDRSDNGSFEEDGICYRILNDNEVEVTYYRDGYYNWFYYPGNIVIPETVTYHGDTFTVIGIGKHAFINCHQLTGIELPPTVTYLKSSAFASSGIQSVDIPNTVTSIEGGAFAYSGLSHVTLPETINSIPTACFAGCSSLTAFSIPNTIEVIGQAAFQECENLREVTIPTSVAIIGNEAFVGTSLNEITIPNSVTKIGDWAFYWNKLTSVTIGRKVETIGHDAFSGNFELTEMYCKSQVPPSTSAYFLSEEMQNQTTLYVPMRSLELYKNTEPWKSFYKIEGMNFVECDVNDDGEINIADVNSDVDAILSGADYDELYDVNGDGEINIADINCILNGILEQ